MPKIDPYIHRCVVKTGPSEGNKYSQEVSYYDILFENTCDNCKEPLVSLREIVAHIYLELQE